ncbi:MAG TPA: hypothetical protein VHX86_18385 [Tepidisphaeraceae bacterium]|jgi:hypothetical protein|nr:hypothetical protein [Tepidisphaeraceae bacterium]
MKVAVSIPKHLLAILVICFVSRALAQTYIIRSSVTDGSGNIVATATTQFSISVTATQTGGNPNGGGNSGSSTPPATQPTASSGSTGSGQAPSAGSGQAPSTGSGQTSGLPVWLASLPGVAGETYGTTQWLDSFKYDANGNLDLTPLIPANACIISTATTPGHQASDYADFNSAQNAAINNGSLCVLFRDGGVYPASAVNQNIQGATGTAGHPFIVGRIGVNGFLDHSQPRPILQSGFGIAGSPTSTHAWGGPMHYLIIDGLNGAAGSGATSWFIRFVDQTAGESSDHVGIFDCAASGFQGGFDLEDDETDANDDCTAFVIEGCSIHDCHGGATQAGLFAVSIRDFLVTRSVFANCGAKNNNGTAHDVYINPNHPNPGDPADAQVRFINDLFAEAAADGCESNYGGFFDHCVSLANPIAFYGGGGFPATIQNCVVDGGGGEFDPSTGSGQVGSALSLAGAGTGRGWGAYLDCATTGSISNLYVINKSDAGDVQYNGGFAVGVHCTDSGKNPEGMPTEATVATVGPNVIVHNWFDASGSNAVNLSQSTPPLPAIAYSGLVVLPGVNGVAGVTGTEPAYVDDTRTCSSYAKTLGIIGVSDGPSLMTAMENNWPGNWDDRLTAAGVVNWIQAGFQVK